MAPGRAVRSPRPMTYLRALVVLLTLSALGGCLGTDTPDTCGSFRPSDAPPVAVVAPTGAATSGTITIDYGADTELPDGYFAAVTLVTDASPAVGSSVPSSDAEVIDVTASGRTLSITVDAYASVVARGSLVASVLLPDPRSFTDCQHPGMTDRYYLTVAVTFDAAGAPTVEVTPTRVLGAI